MHVWNDLGTGKTFSVAWANDILNRCRRHNRTLIIAPISTLETVWKRTFWRVDQTLPVYVLTGSAARRKKLLAEAGQLSKSVCVINADALHLIADEPAARKLDLVIVDEAAMFRNPKARRVEALRKIVGNYYDERVYQSFGQPVKKRVINKEKTAENWQRTFWPMTGSPNPEAPTDVWAVARLVCPDRVPKSFSAFRDLTMVRVSQFKWSARPGWEKIVADMLDGYVIRFKRDDCLDLPPTQVFTHDVAMTAEQKQIIDKLRKEAAAEVAAGLITAANEAVVISKMLQVTSGAVRLKDAEGADAIQRVDCKPKLDALDELSDATDGPLIVFADFKGALATLAYHAEQRKTPYALVLGDTPPARRREIFDAVQRREIKQLIAHPKTIAHGVDLATSNVICWWSPIYSHEIYEQACGRITRATQLRKTLIVHLAASALERKVLRRLGEKQRLQGLLLDYLQGEA